MKTAYDLHDEMNPGPLLTRPIGPARPVAAQPGGGAQADSDAARPADRVIRVPGQRAGARAAESARGRPGEAAAAPEFALVGAPSAGAVAAGSAGAVAVPAASLPTPRVPVSSLPASSLPTPRVPVSIVDPASTQDPPPTPDAASSVDSASLRQAVRHLRAAAPVVTGTEPAVDHPPVPAAPLVVDEAARPARSAYQEMGLAAIGFGQRGGDGPEPAGPLPEPDPGEPGGAAHAGSTPGAPDDRRYGRRIAVLVVLLLVLAAGAAVLALPGLG